MAEQQTNKNSQKTPWTPISIGCATAAGLLVFIVIALVSWRFAYPYIYPTYAARYELRLEVETPRGLKSGSSVIEARYGWQPTLGGLVSSAINDLVGEAVFVDLDDGKNLLVTLTDDRSVRNSSVDAIYLPMRIFPFAAHDKKRTKADIERAKLRGRVNVPLQRLPLVITFADINDPETASRVNPTNLAANFGPGYRIKSATVAMTDKPLAATIEKKLPWLEKLRLTDLVNQGEQLGYGTVKSAVFTELRTGGRKQQ